MKATNSQKFLLTIKERKLEESCTDGASHIAVCKSPLNEHNLQLHICHPPQRKHDNFPWKWRKESTKNDIYSAVLTHSSRSDQYCQANTWLKCSVQTLLDSLSGRGVIICEPNIQSRLRPSTHECVASSESGKQKNKCVRVPAGPKLNRISQ